jgi:biopolymer transport protein ExbD
MSLIAKKKKRVEFDLDITPMIDVVFLLLIFFMVTSTMQPPGALDVPPAKHGIGVDGSTSIFISILKLDNNVKYVCADGDGAEVTIEQAIDYINTQVTPDKTKIIIKADRDVPYQAITQLTSKITQENVQLFVGVRDEK